MNPMWMNTWHGPPHPSMYPYPMPMDQSHHSLSRPASPTHSVKSRKSISSRKSRMKYKQSDSDDEDERRSTFSCHDRSDRKSVSSRFGERKKSWRDPVSAPREIQRRNTKDFGDRVSLGRGRRSVVETSDSEEEYHSDSHQDMIKENSSQEEIADKTELRKKADKTSWECEHCTFVNDFDTKICSICCKTRTESAKIVDQPIEPNLHMLSPKHLPTSKYKKKERKLPTSGSSDNYSRDCSETESMTNRLGNINLLKDELKKEMEMKKGRKITFWPGTKFSTLQTKH